MYEQIIPEIGKKAICFWRKEMTLVELLIFAACLGACGFGLNKLAERVAVKKKRDKKERMKW